MQIKEKDHQSTKSLLLRFTRRVDKCHYCKKTRHFQKDCPICMAWFEKKGKHNAYVCFKSILVEVPYNTWWLDSGRTTHISNIMRRFLTIQTTRPNEKFVLMGNRMKTPMKVVGTYCLILDNGHHLDLLETFYASNISRNLVSISKLHKVGYVFKFGNGCVNFYKNTCMIGGGTLCDGLYEVNLDNLFVETLMTLHHNIGTKHSLANEQSAYLWHKCL